MILKPIIRFLLTSIICFMIIVASNYCTAQSLAELCDNGLDDDGDGMIDLNDEDCKCEVVTFTSLIPNPSFEDMHCCPSDRSQLDCADVWIQASEPTTDYLHTCGWMGWDEYPPPLPFPDGDGAVGFRDGRYRRGVPELNWKEYAGACLLGSLEASKGYRFQFDIGFVDNSYSPPIEVTVFGTTNCAYLPFGVGNESYGCPTNGPNWVRLGSVLVSGNDEKKWIRTQVDIMPDRDINAIAIGPPCGLTTSTQNTYYYFDNLILNNFESFALNIQPINHPCGPDHQLGVQNIDFLNYQWFYNGVALIGETDHVLSQIYGDGQYVIRITDPSGNCWVSESYEFAKPNAIYESFNNLCSGDVINLGPIVIDDGGLYEYTFSSREGCDSIVMLEVLLVEPIPNDTVVVNILRNEVYQVGDRSIRSEGEHLIVLESSKGCDSTVLLQLTYFDILFANIFSPNGDGHNDLFGYEGNPSFVARSQYMIYDRLGNKV